MAVPAPVKRLALARGRGRWKSQIQLATNRAFLLIAWSAYATTRRLAAQNFAYAAPLRAMSDARLTQVAQKFPVQVSRVLCEGMILPTRALSNTSGASAALPCFRKSCRGTGRRHPPRTLPSGCAVLLQFSGRRRILIPEMHHHQNHQDEADTIPISRPLMLLRFGEIPSSFPGSSAWIIVHPKLPACGVWRLNPRKSSSRCRRFQEFTGRRTRPLC